MTGTTADLLWSVPHITEGPGSNPGMDMDDCINNGQEKRGRLGRALPQGLIPIKG